MVEIGGDVFALPLDLVEIVDVRRRDVATVCGCPTVPVRDRVVSHPDLGTIFQLCAIATRQSWSSCQPETITLVIVNEEPATGWPWIASSAKRTS